MLKILASFFVKKRIGIKRNKYKEYELFLHKKIRDNKGAIDY
jgi:hypothetical protein